MEIFSEEVLSSFSMRQLNNLRNYYGLPKAKKKELVKLLYQVINPKDIPIPGDQNMSVRIRRIYEQNKGE